MAAEQRIIGGGLLLVGVGIALLLYFLFSGGGPTPEEAKRRLTEEIWPKREKAEKEGDYLAMQRAAQEAVDLLRKAGSSSVRNYFESLGLADRSSQRLAEALRNGEFEKNAQGLFAFEGRWVPDNAHRGLKRIAETIEGRLVALRRVRETANELRRAFDEVREGSGLPLPLPEAKGAANDEPPFANPNPVYDNDRELFRAFGLPAKELEAAFATPDPKGRSTSARLRWNQNSSLAALADKVAELRSQAQAIELAAGDLDSTVRQVAAIPEASEALAAQMRRAADALAAGLDAAPRAEFDRQRATFEKAENLTKAMRRVAEYLQPYALPSQDLAAALRKRFA